MAGWEEILLTGSYDGIEFDFVSISEEHRNVLDKQQFPGRAGQVIEDRARGPLSIEVLAVFVDDAYPDAMNRLIAAIDSGGIKELVHPIHGAIQVAAERAKEEHNSEDAVDFASVQITFAEHTASSIGPFQAVDTLPALANAAREAADQVQLSADALRAELDAEAADSNTQPPADQLRACDDAGTAATSSSSAVDYLETNSADLTAVDVEATVNNVVAAVDSVNFAIENYQTAEAYQLSHDLTAMVVALEALGAVVIANSPTIIDIVLPAAVPLLVFLHGYYGNSDDVAAFLALNSILDPLEMPAGLPVSVYAV